MALLSPNIGEVNDPLGNSYGANDQMNAMESPKETCMPDMEPSVTPKAIKSIDDADTEPLELHLPNEAVTFASILPEIEKMCEQHDISNFKSGSIERLADTSTAEEKIQDALRNLGINGRVFVERFGHTVKDVDSAQFAKKVASWMAAHPYQTALQLGSGILFFGPGLLAVPALGAAGFGSTGIVSGSIAASQQAAIGNVAARGLFATLQSAAAGGYGVPIVHGVIRAGGMATSGLGMFTSAFGKSKEPTAKTSGLTSSNNEKEDGGSDESLDEEGLSHETESVGALKEQVCPPRDPFEKAKL
ncbi:MAG: hypothetical protein Q9168_005389 [Polycauliona sp. 1 TL-2023]